MASDLFIDEIVPSLKSFKNENMEYIDNKFKVYMEYLKRAEVPDGYRRCAIDNPFKSFQCFKDEEIKSFINDITPYLDGEFNCIFNFVEYIDTDRLATHIIQNYLKRYLVSTEPVKQIIYIDTPLLMCDLKRLINYKDETISRDLVHSLDTVINGVEKADFVIWDKVTLLSTEYERSELYRILSTRHKRGLGNLVFIKGGSKEVLSNLSTLIHGLFKGWSMVNII